MACLLESVESAFCAFGRLTFPKRSCHKRCMTNQSAFPNALSTDQFEDLFLNDEACAEVLFQRRLAGQLRLPKLREAEHGSAQALRPPIPRLQEADGGDGRDVHVPLTRAAQELVLGAASHDLAFERDVDLATPAPSGPRELQVGLNAGAQDPLGDGSRRRVSAGCERAGGQDQRSLSPGAPSRRRAGAATRAG